MQFIKYKLCAVIEPQPANENGVRVSEMSIKTYLEAFKENRPNGNEYGRFFVIKMIANKRQNTFFSDLHSL